MFHQEGYSAMRSTLKSAQDEKIYRSKDDNAPASLGHSARTEIFLLISSGTSTLFLCLNL